MNDRKRANFETAFSILNRMANMLVFRNPNVRNVADTITLFYAHSTLDESDKKLIDTFFDLARLHCDYTQMPSLSESDEVILPEEDEELSINDFYEEENLSRLAVLSVKELNQKCDFGEISMVI